MHTNSFYSEANSTNKCNNTTITLRGVDYVIPDYSSFYWQRLTLEQLTLKLGGRSIVAGGDVSYLTLDSEQCSVSSLSLCIDSRHCSALDDYSEVIFFLYREGSEHPIASFEGGIDTDNNMMLAAMGEGEELSAGRYLLVGGNVSGAAESALSGRLYYVFDILSAGGALQHPLVEEAKLYRKADDVQAGCYTSGTLRLYLQLKTPLIAKSELRAACYSQDWVGVTTASCYHSHERGARERIGITLRGERIWTEGEYFIVLSHNSEPYALLQFHYDGSAEMECTVRQLTAHDVEYMLVKKVEPDKELKWHNVDPIPGMAKAKPCLVHTYCSKDFDALCLEYNLPLLRSQRYASIVAPISLNAERLAVELPYLLHFKAKENYSISCKNYTAEEIREAFIEETDSTIVLCDIAALKGEKLREVETVMQSRSKECHIIFVGNEEELAQLRKDSKTVSEALAAFPRFDLTWPSAAEMLETLRSEIRKAGFTFAPEAEDALARQVALHHHELCRWTDGECRRYIHAGIAQRVRSRVQGEIDEGKEFSPEGILVLCPTDINIADYLSAAPQKMVTVVNEELYRQGMGKLYAMVGLASLKEQLANTFALSRFQENRRRLGLPADSSATHHMLFTGNPGTGKTTVARLIGEIYHAMGYLSKGNVICTDRTELVHPYIGHTEQYMSKLLQKAKGNVLFIDEAYTLCDSTEDRKDFGNHVIEALLPVMADPHSDMIVIFAGYADGMERLMKVNPGLKGRFAHHLHFEDYTADELMQIGYNLLEAYQYVLTDEACGQFRDVVMRTLQCKDAHFCNARWVKQFVESGMLPAMARRVMQTPHEFDNRELYTTIEEVDILAAARIYAPQQPKIQLRSRIGFVA